MKKKTQHLCGSCGLTRSGSMFQKGCCKVCAPYKHHGIYNIDNLSSWARTMIEEERDILDDIEPLRPPRNDKEWVELILRITPPGYKLNRYLPLDVAQEAISNYPEITIEQVVEYENGGTIYYSTENPDEDEEDVPQQFNQWHYQLYGTCDHPCQSDDNLSQALAENLSGATNTNPITRIHRVRKLCVKVLHHDIFMIDNAARGAGPRKWHAILPKSLLLNELLAEILLGTHGQEPLWQLRAGAINDTIYWRNYLTPDTWKKPLKKSFQLLRQIVDNTSDIKATSMGLVVQGKSGARYLLSPKDFRAGCPNTVVLNMPGNSDTLKRDVCIHTELDCKLPLGDKITALALGLVNDVKTAREIEQLARVVDEFLEPGWR